MVEQPEMADAACGRKIHDLAPARVPPATVLREFLRREVSIGNNRRGIAAKGCQPFVDLAVAEFMIGRVHDSAIVALNSISECPAWMIQWQNSDVKPTDLDLSLIDQRYRRFAWQMIEGHRKVRGVENPLHPFERHT